MKQLKGMLAAALSLVLTLSAAACTDDNNKYNDYYSIDTSSVTSELLYGNGMKIDPVVKNLGEVVNAKYSVKVTLDGKDVTEKVYNAETSSDIPVYDLSAAAGRDPYEMFLGGARSIIRITNPNAAKERRLIVFRDSFGSSIAPLLAAGYSEITLVDIRYISTSALGRLVDFTKADDALFLYSASVINNSETIK